MKLNLWPNTATEKKAFPALGIVSWIFLISACLNSQSSLAADKSQLTSPQKSEQVTNTSKADDKIYPDGIVQIPSDASFSPYVFLVDKTERKLFVYETDGEFVKKLAEFPADVGKSDGDKTKRDDHKTPEGIYFLESKLIAPQIDFSLYGSMAFTTNYPNIFDRRDNKTGSGIWLHAVPDSVPLTRGSRGCVVVRDNVIKNLSQYIKLGKTPILIFGKINYLAKNEYLAHKKKFLDIIEKWKDSWQSQKFDSYMSYYDPTFKNRDMNYQRWFEHKKNLAERRSYIKVQLSTPSIFLNKGYIVVRTMQNYESNEHSDFGEKTIYDPLNEQAFSIVREDWKPAPMEIAQKSEAPTTGNTPPVALDTKNSKN